MELGDTANVSERRQSWLQFMFGIGSVKTSKLYLNYNTIVYEEALLYILRLTCAASDKSWSTTTPRSRTVQDDRMLMSILGNFNEVQLFIYILIGSCVAAV